MVLLALMQAKAAVLDVSANCDAIDDAARRAASAGGQLLLTPELFPVGYAPCRLRTDLDPSTLPAIRQVMVEIARQHRIGLVYSLPAVTADGQWRITATLLDGNGTELLSYAKVHLFGPDERSVFKAADAAPAVVDFHGVRTSLAICYDIEFPETARAAALRGAGLLLVPTALGPGFDAVPQVLIRARALENHMAVAYANHAGAEDGIEFPGGSVIAAADGSLLAAAGSGAELLFAEVGVAGPDDADAVSYLRDHRPGTYRGWEG
ncbi:nitrilase-related carbon-nitrogen hydrolase [Arthrobacter sp. PAMC25284]|uniref:nitrilase-related carbon-nitrogen hydrolase n=1 Tax=Arthrobacter sp. PAMC25284 TaxID=2861279 RepID=UPI001C63027A|nr:nitrilase-related carbon-nitrogen hydrolase [Arthrobacter sp. PAMC25284]QYF90997.1 nitrilase [Arthrobacter sp. PAMC25284]